jgi:hypothetical protein
LKKKSLRSNTAFITFCSDHNGLELENLFKINCKHNFKKKVLYVIFRLLLSESLTNYPRIVAYPIKLILNFLGFNIIRDSIDYNYNPEFLKSNRGINFYYGGWHSELYYKDEVNQIRKVFSFDSFVNLNSYNFNILDLINRTNSVSVHVRRGDYMNTHIINLFGNICNLDYYKSAIIEIEKRVIKPHYFIFSNDMSWVKSNIKLENVTFVEGNEGVNSWIDLYLMSKCKNHINANSTFSWWGAWLNNNNNKIVVCPSKFSNIDVITDVYPSSWLKVYN